MRKCQKSQWTGCTPLLWVQAECHINSDKENCHESCVENGEHCYGIGAVVGEANAIRQHADLYFKESLIKMGNLTDKTMNLLLK